MYLLKNISQLLTLEKAHQKDGRNLKAEDISIIKNAALVYNKDKILWVGAQNELPGKYKKLKGKSLKGKCLIPEIVDCHTHLVFGGDRSHEYVMRLNGESYEKIAAMGGGILSTVSQTQNKSIDELFKLAVKRIEKIRGYGIGTIEIKSGYGLSFEAEYNLAKVIHKLKKHFKNKIQICSTYMAAHAVPKNFPSSAAYMQEVVLPLLQKLAKEQLIDAVDIFHEPNYFTQADVIKLFEAAKKYKLPCKSHADEFKEDGGGKLAAQFQALSADHLLSTSDDSIRALATAETVATLLPGTAFFLGKPQANAKKLLDAGCKVAIASDFNPGSCHWDNVLQIACMAAPTYKMNQTQMWAAITLNAAHALGFKNQGALVAGLKPRFSVFNTDSIDKITYSWGQNLAGKSFF
ncbi:MAG: imidazolonepropionase [Bacteriovoracaceae bacterium]|nr:imidazolonepropionase [Bacteriovoracaceae bacterium]